MRNSTFDRKRLEDPEEAARLERLFDEAVKAGDDDTEYRKAVEEGDIVEGPLDENGKPLFNR